MSDNYIYPLYKTSSNSDTTWEASKRITLTESINLVPDVSFYFIDLQTSGAGIGIKPPSAEDDRVGFTVKLYLDNLNGNVGPSVYDRLVPGTDPEDEIYAIDCSLSSSGSYVTLMWMGDFWGVTEYINE